MATTLQIVSHSLAVVFAVEQTSVSCSVVSVEVGVKICLLVRRSK